MSVLIVAVLIGLLSAYFASINPGAVTINLINYTLTIPLYTLVLGSLLLGLLVSWIISMVDGIIVAFAMSNKEGTIKESEKAIQKLEQRVNDLEIENARLKGHDDGKPTIELRDGSIRPASTPTRSLFDKLRHSFN